MHRVAPLEIIKLIMNLFIILKKCVPSGKDGKHCTCHQSIMLASFSNNYLSNFVILH